ncbi:MULTISPECIES: NADH:ubiquinone reductase (Na(+)-transporting) subunit B [Prosthecochloris]|uniref:Na(+)-translocating NADH-quinone reductase subunit B n=1 Tax=Prosthecochloris vibrioformis TaxID=1098 RepID=A0A5C4S3P9_PROVB|nr:MULTISPECIES: NADH:ubiquinone reductase (Na(+)-transporting) subunit B [Prosthecochloris]ANT65897.1 Na(+)-translocating NADH-quinone reductase subunit B [Prosthecochloris sp. CIB 2401]TNJ37739.1 NADH:ubiquinone reductase (Na(+)-transporting) subunit B [Prosthecochloris vibrioformis]
MRNLRNILDGIAPHFTGEGRLQRLYPLYEMLDTMLYTPGEVTSRAPHIRDAVDMKRSMVTVILALFPALLFGAWNTGHQHDPLAGWGTNFAVGLQALLPVLFVSYLVGGFWEVLFAVIRRHEINEGFLVTGMLYALILPPAVPLWMTALGISFGVVIGKEVTGGTGYNIFNPALVARAFVFFAYPSEMSGDAVWYLPDAVSAATPLAVAASVDGASGIRLLGEAGYTLQEMFWGTVPGSFAETSVAAIALGAVLLAWTKIASWRIMAGGLLGMSVLALIGNAFASSFTNPMLALSPMHHLVMGSFAFGLVFMATDPVSAAQTDRGRWIYGFGIGALVVLIRVINPAFAEGTMLAILLGNAFSPMIDYGVLRANISRRRRGYAKQ